MGAAILLVAAGTLLGSFLCSLFEAALYAITPSQLEVLCSRRVRGARKLAALRADVTEPITAILTINTVTHTVGAAVLGAMVASAYGNRWVGAFAAIFTVLVLVVTEIVPKTIGVRHAVTLGPRIAWPLQAMIWSVLPVVKAASWIVRRMSTGAGHAGPTEEEVMSLSRLAAQAGTVRPQEQRWVENALRLDRVTAGDLRTPRTVVQSLPADTPLEDLRDLGTAWVHSRIPITDPADPESLTGLVYRRDVFDALAAGASEGTLADFARRIEFVPEAMPAHALLDVFLRDQQHLVAVADEYGGFEGVVTLEDVLECLLGSEIVDEHDDVEDMQELARREARRRPGTEGAAAAAAGEDDGGAADGSGGADARGGDAAGGDARGEPPETGR